MTHVIRVGDMKLLLIYQLRVSDPHKHLQTSTACTAVPRKSGQHKKVLKIRQHCAHSFRLSWINCVRICRPTDWTPSSFGEDVTMQKRRTASRATAPKLPQASHGKGRGGIIHPFIHLSICSSAHAYIYAFTCSVFMHSFTQLSTQGFP